ncbi:MAG: hypothetical protein ACK5YF_03650 [Rhodobacterales bacterium]
MRTPSALAACNCTCPAMITSSWPIRFGLVEPNPTIDATICAT